MGFISSLVIVVYLHHKCLEEILMQHIHDVQNLLPLNKML